MSRLILVRFQPFAATSTGLGRRAAPGRHTSSRRSKAGLPIRGLLALSDWPIETRLIGPWSERADHLAATAQLARQLAWLNERDQEVGERLAGVVADMARSIPGAIDGPEVDTARVVAAAEAEGDELANRDDPWRAEAGVRARRQLNREQQLWGRRSGLSPRRMGRRWQVQAQKKFQRRGVARRHPGRATKSGRTSVGLRRSPMCTAALRRPSLSQPASIRTEFSRAAGWPCPSGNRRSRSGDKCV